MGASLLAMTDWQATHSLNVKPQSRASSLLQGAVVACLIVADIAPTYICIFLRGTAQPHVQVLIA
ncbi:hypothetical protein EMIT0P43_80106 [Pseudomonas jessenii]